MQTTLELITDIFANLLKKPGLKLVMTDSPNTVSGWDSLTHPELISEIEEKLEIEFDFRELAGIKNIADLVHLTDSKLNKDNK
jgi:acyl carrier protein